MSGILLIYWPIGPTFKERVKSNLRSFDAYKFFDILLLTDDEEYFNDLQYPNVKIMDLNYYRSLYPEFNEFEKLPEEKRDSGLYKNQFNQLLDQGKRFSINLQRFALLYENIDKYKYISILDCDMIPIHDETDFDEFKNYLDNTMPVNSISTNRAYYTWDTPENLQILSKYSKELSKDINISYPIEGCDGLFKIYKFENYSTLQEFFNVWNYILFDSFKASNHLISGGWNILIEEILAIVYKLLNIRVNSEPMHYHGVNKIKSFNFPEDRYCEDWTHQDFDVSAINKEDFIDRNYDKLKSYYEHQGLKFAY